MAELKQEEESEEELVEFCWSIFGLDLCGIVRKDLQYLFTLSNANNESNTADSMYVDPKEQEKMEMKQKLKENATMIISNNYGKILILYSKYDLLISFNSVQLTTYLNDTYEQSGDDIPVRGSSPPQNMYRILKYQS